MRWAGMLAGSLLVLAACSSPAPAEPSRQATTAQVSASPDATRAVVVHAVQPGSTLLPGLAVRPSASPSPLALPLSALPLSALAWRSGTDVRVALELLLQEQVFLTAQAMDAATSARLDELVGVSGTLDQNSLAFAEILGAVKNQTAAQILLQAWRGSVADLISYAQGQQASASTDLDQRRTIIAAQLAVENFPSSQADALLRARLQAQLSLADAIIAHDAAQSSQRLRDTADASDDLARPLASGLAARAPDLAPKRTEGPDIDVRSRLTRAFQAHVYLTGAATAAAADGRSADLQALVAAGSANATDLGAQLDQVFGSQVGDAVGGRLRAETAALVSAASGGDHRQAAEDLDRLRGEIDGLLASANALLPPGLLKQELRASDQPLLTAADAFAARDYPSGFIRLREAARQAQKAADSVALSIVDRYPGRYSSLPAPRPTPAASGPPL